MQVQEQSATASVDLGLSRFGPLRDIVCCPISRTPLRLVGKHELLSRISAADRSRIGQDLVGAFVSDAVSRAYAIHGPIVNFLASESFPLDDAPPASFSKDEPAENEAKSSVRRWYDEYGWQKNEQGMYHDSAAFSQNAPIGNGLYELLSHLRVIERLSGGEWLMDAASGAIAHPEYLTYSWFYKRRVCIDFSVTALREAASKLRATDYCCQADICQLPFRDDAFQGGISGYTIQHFPETQQAVGVRELYRVLDRGAHICFFTDARYSRAHDAIRLALRFIAKILTIAGGTGFTAAAADDGSTGVAAPHALYFRARDTKWWREVGTSLTPSVKVEALRLLTRNEFRRLFGDSNRAARMLEVLETSFPRLLASASAYCLVDLEKPGERTRHSGDGNIV
jgi:SAM-dependent methyltransferase/uncharacterized protein YbaR (Trm112 family)